MGGMLRARCACGYDAGSICAGGGMRDFGQPATMRRTFNNVLRRSAVDGQVLRSLTGHSSEAMTARYSTIDERERHDAVAKVVHQIHDGGSSRAQVV